MLAHSSQAEPIDSMRRDSVLHRTSSAEVVAWVQRSGITRARGPVRVPGQIEAGILDRLCAPVRYRGQPLGYLWLIDPGGRICDDLFDAIAQAAHHAAQILHYEQLARRPLHQALSNLLSPSPELRDAAARQLLDQTVFTGGSVVAVVIQPLEPASRADLEAVFEEGLSDVSWMAPAGGLLEVAYGDHGVLLVPVAAGGDDSAAAGLARAGREAVFRRLAPLCAAPRVVAGIGDPQPELARAATSYRQARLAARAAEAMPGNQGLAAWRDLGVFRTLTQLPAESVGAAIDPRVVALLRSGDHAVIETLETYLDLGCDAKATAEALHLHRGTLYYRLEKAERISGIDMHSGFDRLAVHLGLKLDRLGAR